jgi:hypothetical protein
MQIIEPEPEAERPLLRGELTPPARRDLVFDLSQIYLEVGLNPADAIRSALADFECYFGEPSPCAI